MNIGLLGYGTVGGGVDRILKGHPELHITRILSLFYTEEMGERYTENVEDILNDPTIETVVEVLGGIHPAYEWITAAMRAGKNVVTANKAVAASYYRELVALSKEMKVSFRCTAAAGGGIPWLTSLERVKENDCVLAVFGVMNGSCNYILTEMEKGADFQSALRDAQEKGFAEKDPSADIDGPDTLRKLMLSTCVAFNGYLPEEEIPCRGIRNVTREDIDFLKKQGYRLKLFAYAERKDGCVLAVTEPCCFPENSVFSHVPGNLNLIAAKLHYGGTLSFMGEGAGRFPTAENVVRDLNDVLLTHPAFYADSLESLQTDHSRLCRSYIVRTEKEDAFLKEHTVRREGAYLFTSPVPVTEMHRVLAALELGGTSVFAAAVPEEESYA